MDDLVINLTCPFHEAYLLLKTNTFLAPKFVLLQMQNSKETYMQTWPIHHGNNNKFYLHRIYNIDIYM